MYKPHIVILGAGYGGLMTAVRLQKILRVNEANITLVNRNDYHYQTTCLHENAAGTLKPEHTMIPIRDIINQEKIDFIIDDVVLIKKSEKKVKLKSRELSYDILVVSLGFEAQAAEKPASSSHIFPIENLSNARVLREHLEYNFAMYANEENKNTARLTIVIAGGGLTGIEYAGELVNRIPALSKEYDIAKSQVRIINLECESSILGNWNESLIDYAMNSLVSRGVEFITGAHFLEATEDIVVYEKEGKRYEIHAKTLVWAGGVRANSLLEKSGVSTSHGKAEVRNDLRIIDHDDIYVIGDCALIRNPETNTPYPATAKIAVEAAMVAARNIKAQIDGQALCSFKAKNAGVIASLGYNDAVGVLFNGRKYFGWKAALLKKLSENRYLFQLGGMNLLFKKGRFNIINH